MSPLTLPHSLPPAQVSVHVPLISQPSSFPLHLFGLSPYMAERCMRNGGKQLKYDTTILSRLRVCSNVTYQSAIEEEEEGKEKINREALRSQ